VEVVSVVDVFKGAPESARQAIAHAGTGSGSETLDEVIGGEPHNEKRQPAGHRH
jgi:hypothetical protein